MAGEAESWFGDQVALRLELKSVFAGVGAGDLEAVGVAEVASLLFGASGFSVATSGAFGSVGLRLVTVCITAKVPKPRNRLTAAKRPSIALLNRLRLGDSDSVIAVPEFGIEF